MIIPISGVTIYEAMKTEAQGHQGPQMLSRLASAFCLPLWVFVLIEFLDSGIPYFFTIELVHLKGWFLNLLFSNFSYFHQKGHAEHLVYNAERNRNKCVRFERSQTLHPHWHKNGFLLGFVIAKIWIHSSKMNFSFSHWFFVERWPCVFL